MQQNKGCDHEEASVCRDSVFEYGLLRNATPLAGFVDGVGDLLGTVNEVRPPSRVAEERFTSVTIDGPRSTTL